jgi:hypothetical protein
MKFARVVFLVAGIYGLLVTPPHYFLESHLSKSSPPPITHPEFFYGFLGVTTAWQVLFLVISRNPIRYRGAMIPAILEKVSFVAAMIVLFLQNRATLPVLVPAGPDALLGVLFIAAFLKTRSLDRAELLKAD